MADHRRLQDELRRAGFRNVRIEYVPGPHTLDPQPLGMALDRFWELATQPAAPR